VKPAAANGSRVRARLIRGGQVYARGDLRNLVPTRELLPGRYLLTLVQGGDRERIPVVFSSR
jgi:hypothetical protein